MVNLLRTLVFLTFPAWPLLCAASVQGNGTVTMDGQILESACSIHTDDVWQEIPFGVISYNNVIQQAQAVTKPFAVRLVNCSLARRNGDLWRSVDITFDGETTQLRPDIFVVHGEAQGLGLRIHSQVGDVAMAGEPMPEVMLKNKDNELRYLLSVVRDGKTLSEGDWYGIIRFMVAYQ